MSGQLSTVGETNALGGVITGTQYLALLTTAPTVATTPATMVEYSVTGYSRQVCAFGSASGTPSQVANTSAITFGALTGATGATVVGYWALVTSASGTTGSLVAFGSLTPSVTPSAGSTVTVAIGACTVSIN